MKKAVATPVSSKDPWLVVAMECPHRHGADVHRGPPFMVHSKRRDGIVCEVGLPDVAPKSDPTEAIKALTNGGVVLDVVDGNHVVPRGILSADQSMRDLYAKYANDIRRVMIPSFVDRAPSRYIPSAGVMTDAYAAADLHGRTV